MASDRGRGGGRRSLPSSKRRQVLDAAQELFGLVGFAKTGVREIADRAGVSPATIYAHFEGGKAAVLEAALEERVDGLVSALAEVGGGDGLEAFLVRIVRLSSEVASDPFLRRALSEGERVDDPRLRQRGREIEAGLSALARSELERLRDQGVVGDVDLEAVVTLVRSATQGWLVAASAGLAQASHERMVVVLVDALGPLLRQGTAPRP